MGPVYVTRKSVNPSNGTVCYSHRRLMGSDVIAFFNISSTNSSLVLRTKVAYNAQYNKMMYESMAFAAFIGG